MPQQTNSLAVLFVLLASLLSGDTAHEANASDSKAFSFSSPWTVMKRPDGTCFAVAKGFHGDYFVLSSHNSRVYISLGNAKFDIPAGNYPIGVSLRGSRVSDEANASGTVEPGKANFITVELEKRQLGGLLKASLLSISLAGESHRLFLGDTASLYRDLDTCPKYDSDPLKSAR